MVGVVERDTQAKRSQIMIQAKAETKVNIIIQANVKTMMLDLDRLGLEVEGIRVWLDE